MPAERRQVDVAFVDPDSIVIESHMGSRGRTALLGLALVGVVLLVYARALAGGFIILDDQTVVQNLPLRSFYPGVWNIWTHPTISPHYQPLAYTLFALEFRLFGTHAPAGYLAVNLVLHASNVLLFWVVLRRLQLPAAFASAALFAAHPMNAQAVSWISQQPLLLCGFFSLLSIFVWMRWTGMDPAPPDVGKLFRLPASPGLLLMLTILLLCAALGCHSIAIALPGVMLVMVWWERATLSRRELRAAIPLIVICLVRGLVTLLADSRRDAAMGTLLGESLMNRFLSRLSASWGYLWHAAAPIKLSVIDPGEFRALWMGVAALLIAAVLSTVAWLLRPRIGRGPFAVVACVLLLLVPTLLFRSDLDQWTQRADHLFYFPLAVVIAAVAGWIASFLSPRSKWVRSSIPFVAGAALALLTIVRVGDFRDSQRLWESVLRNDPNSVIALNQLGRIELEQDRDFSQARARFQHALATDPKNLQALLNLAYSYELEGDLDRMSMRYQEALSLAPNDPQVHMGLGNVLAAKGRHQQAIEEYERVLATEPTNHQAVYRMGMVYRSMGDVDRATELLSKALHLNPGEPGPYIDLANIAFARGDFGKAKQMLEAAAELNPSNFRIYVNIGAQLGSIAEANPQLSAKERNEWRAESLKYLRYAVWLNPASAEARYNLGGVLFNARKLDEAIFHLNEAVRLSPSNRDFQEALRLARQVRAEDEGQ